MTRSTVLFTAFLVAATAYADELANQAMGILKKNCLACHNAALKSSNLDLSTRDAAMAGGERGEAVVPNYPNRSRAYLFATHESKPAMPPAGKLAAADLEVLRKWILAGAVWGESAVGPKEAEVKAAQRALEERPITAEERSFWSFRKPVRPALPANGEANAVDALLKAKWAEKNLRPSPEAGKRTLVRRAYLDLVGLPPTPEQVNAFLADTRADAWDRLVESLLASPHYGERWARRWLDLVRYADSGGFEYDSDRPSAWRYRDWIVNAFNSDKPYDRFILEQVAGDELDDATSESRIATGFLRLGPEHNIKNEMTRADELDDIISTTALAFQGLTLGCARCHNHKFDPIPQKDYYSIQAVFFSTRPGEHPLADPALVARTRADNKRIDDLVKPLRQREEEIEKPWRDKLLERKLAELPPHMAEAWRTPAEKRNEAQRLNARQIERAIAQIDQKYFLELMPAEARQERDAVRRRIREIEKQRPAPYASAMVIAEEGREALPSYFLHRGSPSNKGSLMQPGVFSVAAATPFQPLAPPPGAQSSHRRRGFAQWLASAENPLTARVMVNRIWQHHFGEGIVATPNNFGKKGEPPTHPELLDWLATEFVDRKWSIKAMHRLIMKSKAYRMASDDIEANRAADPGNRMLWRMPRQRLDVEAIRDSMLAVSGALDATVGGPAVLPYIDPALFQGSSRRTWNGKPDTDASTWRRSLYVFNKRSIRYPLFESFDQPDMITSCARRNSSITAPQALLMMNNAAVRLHASQFAERLRREAGGDVERQVRRGFELALARAPRPDEAARSAGFIRSDDHGLVDFCQALFNLNEFVFMP